MQQQAAASMYTAHDAPCVAVDESSSTGAGSSLLGTVAARLHALSASSWSPPLLLGAVARIIDRIPLPCAALLPDQPEPAERDAGRTSHDMCYNRRELGRDYCNK